VAKRIVFRNAFLIDGQGSEPIDNGLVVVEDDRVVHIGVCAKEDLDNWNHDAEDIDLQGMTLMPGLIDVHVHLSLDGSVDYVLKMLKERSELTVLKAAQRVKKALESGYTTLRCMGDKDQIDIALKVAIEEGVITGPRIVASGNVLTITGGHGDMFPPGVHAKGLGRIVDGADEARKGAREQLKAGADNIKLMATGGGMSPGPGTVAQLSVAEMQAAVEEAENYGITTGAHAIGSQGIINALEAGVRTIEHGSFLDEKGIELLLEKESFLVPTLSAFKTLKYGKDGGVSEDVLKKVQYFSTAHTDNLKKAISAGVQIVAGTDAGTPFNYLGDNAYELECLVSNGLSPMQAIQSATKIAAKALKLENLGTIETGKIADLIVVDGNPLANINILQEKERIKKVYKEGKAIKQ